MPSLVSFYPWWEEQHHAWDDELHLFEIKEKKFKSVERKEETVKCEPRFSSECFLHNSEAVSRILSSFDFISLSLSSLVKIIDVITVPFDVIDLINKTEKGLKNAGAIDTRTYFTAGSFEFRNLRASTEARATKAACCVSLRLPVREDVVCVDCWASCWLRADPTVPVEVNGLIPLLNPSNSLMTVIIEDRKETLYWHNF